MPIDPPGTDDRLAQIERLIEHYRLAKKRRLQRMAMTLWRQFEAQQALAELEKPLEWVH